MIYHSETFYIKSLQLTDALHLNKFFVYNTNRFKHYLPKTLAANRTLESTKSYILQKQLATEAKTEFVYVVKTEQNNNIAGLIILKALDWNKKQGEFAYCIGEEFKGKGWMTKAIKATSDFAFNELKLETLQIITHKNNTASIKVAENSGYKWKVTLKDEFTTKDETSLDMELYELHDER